MADNKLSNMAKDYNKKINVFNSLQVGPNKLRYKRMVQSFRASSDNHLYEVDIQKRQIAVTDLYVDRGQQSHGNPAACNTNMCTKLLTEYVNAK